MLITNIHSNFKFGESWILQEYACFEIFVHISEYLLICNLHKILNRNNLYQYIRIFFMNRLTFTSVFALRIRSSILTSITSPVSSDMIFCHKKIGDCILNWSMKLDWNRLNILTFDVLVSIGSRIFDWKWALKYTTLCFQH